MAKVVASFFDPEQNSEYDWDNWFDGQKWELKQGVDFRYTPSQFRDILVREALTRGVTVKELLIINDKLYVQADKK